MPELATTGNRGIQTPIFQPLPPSSYFDRTPPSAPIVDTSALSAASGKAALYGSISKVLSELPQTLIDSYEAGRKLRIGNQVDKQYQEALANPSSGQLSNFAATTGGDVKFAPQDAELRRLQLASLTGKTTTLYDRANQTLTGVGSPVQPAPSGQLSSPVVPVETPMPAGQLSKVAFNPSVPSEPGLSSANRAALADAMPQASVDNIESGSLLPDIGFVPAGKNEAKAGIEKRPDGTIVRTFPGGKMVAVTPENPNVEIDITPKEPKAVKPQEGMVFATGKAASDAGYDPTDAEVLPDGTIRVTKFKPSGTDAKGKSKITDAQKSALAGASVLSKSIDGMMDEYDALEKRGMTGPIHGRIEEGKQKLGMGSEEGSKVQSQMQTSLFKIARMLNGAGVLTDSDIKRAEAVAPTLKMGRSQFKGQLEAVKGTVKDGLETWLQTNAGQATDEQVALAKQAINSLSEKPSEAAGPATSSETEFSAALAWVNAHPTDPRSATIKSALRAKGVAVE